MGIATETSTGALHRMSKPLRWVEPLKSARSCAMLPCSGCSARQSTIKCSTCSRTQFWIHGCGCGSEFDRLCKMGPHQLACMIMMLKILCHCYCEVYGRPCVPQLLHMILWAIGMFESVCHHSPDWHGEQARTGHGSSGGAAGPLACKSQPWLLLEAFQGR